MKSRRLIIPRRVYTTYGYRITRHAIMRMKQRLISKGQLGYSLVRKPLYKTKVKYDKGRPSYLRYSRNGIVPSVNPIRKKVPNVRRYGLKELLRMIRRNR